MSLIDVRKGYQSRENALTEEKLSSKEPIQLLNEWFELAKKHPNILEPHAVCLATATKDGKPSARLVLCKSHNKEGFTIFTHYTSRKGQELAENPHCALTYYWEPFNRSVRIEGIAEKLPFSVADDYFQKRPYDSKIGALCSDQSKPIKDRNVLMDKDQQLKDEYPNTADVPRPPQWGGYLIRPHTMEFWQGQTDRIHDRIRFRKLKDGETIDESVTHAGDDGWYYERGGYLIRPHTMEFWQGQTDRIHDRIRFRKLKDGETIDESVTHAGDDGWYYERLAP